MGEIKTIQERERENRIFVRAEKPPYPSNMLVELTNACNHRCVFCTNRKMTRKIRQIDEDLLYRVLSEAHSLGTTDVGFYATGEPFASRNLEKYVAEAKGIGFKYVYITTNGGMATPERLKSVIDAGLDSIKFSINAGTAETYKRIHGKDDFDRVMNNLQFASKYRDELTRPLKIYVSHIATRQTQAELDILSEKIRHYVDDIIANNVSNQGGWMFEVNGLLTINSPQELIFKPPCSMIFNRFHITCEGYLTACCVDYQNYLVTADLNKVSLKEAWYSNVFIDLRQRHLENRLEETLCYNCLYNCYTSVVPLMPEYATIYDPDTFSSVENIIERI